MRLVEKNSSVLPILAAAVSFGLGNIALGDAQFQILNVGTLATDSLAINPSATVNQGGQVNVFGQVSGYSRPDQAMPSFAFRTEPDSPIDPVKDNLGTFTGGTAIANQSGSTGYAVGPTGITVGQAFGSANGVAFISAFRTAPNGPITDGSALGTLGAGTSSTGFGINDSGQTVGSSATSGNNLNHAFRTAANGVLSAASDLGVAPSVPAMGTTAAMTYTSSQAYGINDSGQTVGFSTSTTNGTLAFRTSATGLVSDPGSSLGILAAAQSRAYNINASGRVVGSTSYDTAHASYYEAFRTTATGGIDAGSIIGLAKGGAYSRLYGINDAGQASGNFYDPSFNLYAAFVDANNNTLVDLNTTIPADSGWGRLSSAPSINNMGQIAGYGQGPDGLQDVFLLTPTSNLTWLNSTGNGTWNTGSVNFNNAANVASAYTDSSTSGLLAGNNVNFNDNNGGAANYNVTLTGVLHPNYIVVYNSAGNYVFSGTGGIAGPGGIAKGGTGSLTLNTVNSYAGATLVAGGTLILGVKGALPANTPLTISPGTSVVANSLGAPYGVALGSISGLGTFQANNNGLVLSNSSIGTVTALLASGYNAGAWNGTTGIISSVAGSSASHSTALGVIINDTTGNSATASGTAMYSSLNGTPAAAGNILVKLTYYGDANLDGMVDGADYALIDNGFAKGLTGWYNGDFNYDGVINGSDYTLIDNAFNTQGAHFSTLFSAETASEIATVGAAVPEPASLGVLGIAAVGLLGRRRANRTHA